jgi:hypothetical protein
MDGGKGGATGNGERRVWGSNLGVFGHMGEYGRAGECGFVCGSDFGWFEVLDGNPSSSSGNVAWVSDVVL